MHQQEFIGQKQDRNYSGLASTFLRITLLFGSIAVALSLVLVPMVVSKIEAQFSNNLFEPNVDRISTSSITPRSLSYDNRPVKEMQFHFNGNH